ncbi:MAG TPA: hypothetical protein PKV27_08135, partial [Ilumatobacteraceae bacterium]|nr:hypothetical protein [Ilumatobacteraceae bacterium]
NNGRPDLRNRFIVGVGSDYVLGDTGGDDLLTGLVTSELGAIGGGTTGSHALTIAEIPAHTHDVGYRGSNASSSGADQDFVTEQGSSALDGQIATSTVGGGAGHSHSVDPIPAHSHDIPEIDNRPPYFALYFIIKTDPAGEYGGVGAGGGDGSMYSMYDEDGCTTYIGGRATLMDDLAISSSQVQLNCCASNVFRLVLTENVTFLAPNNPISGQVINLIIKQGGSGSYTVTWPDNFMFPGGTAPSLTSAVGSIDIMSCQYDSADNVWYVIPSQSFS